MPDCQSHAVIFESIGTLSTPGRPGLINDSLRAAAERCTLSFLSAPNIINTLYGHAGTVVRLYIPHVATRKDSVRHAIISVCKSFGRAALYGGVVALGATGLGVPMAAAVVGVAAVTVVSTAVGIAINDLAAYFENIMRQHEMANLVAYGFVGAKEEKDCYKVKDYEAGAQEVVSHQLRMRMHGWPTGKELLVSTAKALVKGLLLFDSTSCGVHTMFNANAMLEKRIREMQGYSTGSVIGDAELDGMYRNLGRRGA